ncbi:hypothetical protein [Streptomyces formicae]|uniref:Uncharacterized protein n=1 Tax=Streptomyces formicae TaxID=1616117 RepID=A0ABY3WIC1_9ACTN|nr:hypothetical protein [Streptomyces formicae]UNM12328.1 hypothetical protein J4032_12985 [Streptomyces formicae]
MSDYSFGYDPTDDQSDLGEAESQQQGPKWFREGLAKLSGQVQELKAENERLKAEQVKDQVVDALKAKGYAPAAAGLFTGTPDKLDDWLSTNGAALAKLPAEGQELTTEQAPAGPPASTVPAEGQEQMQRMMEQGTQNVAPPQGSDKEVAAAIAACQTEEEYAQIMRSHGNRHDFS